jgi:glycosyltransferase involved in cell wall biosynthesis
MVPASLEAGLVSILVPLYNEVDLVAESLAQVMHAPLPAGLRREIVVVDDGSTDGSREVAADLVAAHPDVLRLVLHDRNQGKGAAIRTAIGHARGQWTIFQDADLEYDPREYPRLLRPLLEGRADAVYGSRFMAAGERRVLYYWHAVGNRLLTMLCNMAADLNLTDMETCYKAFRTSLLKSIPIRSRRFGIEPEITIKLAQRDVRIYETPISYHGRTYEEGKKVGFLDALQALGVILRFWVRRDIYTETGPEILDVLSNTPRFNRWMADTIRPYVGERVMEMGAGIGNLTRELSPKRRRYIASDIDEEHLTRLAARFRNRRHIEVRHCDLERTGDFAPFAGQLDTVVCLNVLEHVPGESAALENMRSVLAPGGRAIILVPEGMSVYGSLDEVLGHCRRYSEAELRQRIEEHGLEVERVIPFNRVTRPGWFVEGRVFKRRTFSRGKLIIFDRLVWLWRAIDGLLPWRPVSLIAIARRRDQP